MSYAHMTATAIIVPVTVNQHLVSTQQLPGNVYLHVSSHLMLKTTLCSRWYYYLPLANVDLRPKAFCFFLTWLVCGRNVTWSEPASLWSLSFKHCAVLSPRTHTAVCVQPLRSQRLNHSQLVHIPATGLSPFPAALLRAADMLGQEGCGSFVSTCFGGPTESLVMEHVYCSFPSYHP